MLDSNLIFIIIITGLIIFLFIFIKKRKTYEVDLSNITDDMPLDALSMIDEISKQKKNIDYSEPRKIITKDGKKIDLNEIDINLKRLYSLREKLIQKRDSGQISDLTYKNLLKRYKDKIMAYEKIKQNLENYT